MMQSLKSDQEVKKTFDMQQTSIDIQNIVDSQHIGYLEAVIQWMEENSIPENNYNKYISESIVELIREEVIRENRIKPSLVKLNEKSSLDFMF